MPSSDPNLDALMVDWLYDELTPTEARSFEEHLRTHPEVQAEVSALKRTRAAFQDMQQSEPAPALTSILLHEAALAVEKQPGFWARVAALFQPVFLHPAASAMATVIVVAGVAGALYSRNGDMMVEPMATRSESAAQVAAPATAPATASRGGSIAPLEIQKAGAKLGERTDYAVDMASEQEEDSIEEASTVVALPEKREAKKSVPRSFKANKKRSTDGVVIGGIVANAVSGAGAFAQPPEPNTDADAEDSSSGFGDKLELSGRKEEVAQEGKYGRRRVAKPKQSGRQSSPQGLRKKMPAKDASWEANQMASLKAAKGKKRCNEVSQIANDILDKKPKYYKDKVAGTKVVGDCGAYVANETRRRSKVRSKQGRKGAPSKRAASPDREAAAQ